MMPSSDLIIQYGLQNIETTKKKGFIVGMIFRASYGFGMVILVLSIFNISNNQISDTHNQKLVVENFLISSAIIVTFTLFYWSVFMIYRDKALISSINGLKHVMEKNSIEGIDYLEISTDYHLEVISGVTLSSLHRYEPFAWWLAFITVELVTYFYFIF